MRSTTSPSPHIPRFSPTPPSPTRAFVQKTLRFGSYLCELCSFLVLGMITYNLHPFAIDKRWLLLFVLVIYLVRYASVTGVMATAVHWLKPGYFMEKFVCTTDDYFFDYETAKGELRERKTMLLEEYRDNHPDMLANGETEYQDDLDERETDLLGSFNSEKGFVANPVAFSAWLEMDEDGVETVPYMGRTIAHRIWLWLAAFKMAYEALQDTSTERYTQEYLDAIERNTPPRNGAPIGRDSFEWAGCAEELSVCNVAHLLAAAKRTPGYFQVRSALCGMPVIRERYADTMALLNKVKGTDAYDILAQLMQQAEREA